MKSKYIDLIIDGKKYNSIQELADTIGFSYYRVWGFIHKNKIQELTKAIVYQKTHSYTPIEGEIWKDIQGYEDRYRVSNKGRVLRLYDGHGNYSPLLVGYTDKSPNKKRYANAAVYRRVRLPVLDKAKQKEGCTKDYRIHRLVAIAFIPNPNNYPEVNHKNGDGTDNRVENLEWCTSHDNALHARVILKHGIPNTCGESNARAKLNWDTIRQIRKEYAEDSTLNYAMLGEKYNIHKTAIGEIIRNERWMDKDYVPPERSHYYIKHKITEKKKCLNRKIIPVTVPADIVKKIREEYSTNTITQTELSKKYNIKRGLISAIINYHRGYAKIR